MTPRQRRKVSKRDRQRLRKFEQWLATLPRHRQSRLGSIMENLTRIAGGQVVAICIWLFLQAPIFCAEMNTWELAVAINFPFLVASLVWGYMVRRSFVRFFRG